jgi:predicted metal-dependent hydrolase
MPLRLAVADALARGQVLYNERRFWDAHDAWEEAWLVESGEVRRMLQGLIQVTAGYHNAFVRCRPGGVVKQLAAGLEKLETIPDELGGLSLEVFRRAVAGTLEEARRWHRGESDGLDVAAVPRLETLRA